MEGVNENKKKKDGRANNGARRDRDWETTFHYSLYDS